ncbi:MAG: hypothetical protein AAFQ57_09100 [Cyanobacteria bacterium J06626_14]
MLNHLLALGVVDARRTLQHPGATDELRRILPSGNPWRSHCETDCCVEQRTNPKT